MKYLFIDIEATGLDWKSDRVHGIGYAFEEDEVRYVTADSDISELQAALADPSTAKVGHNVRFDLRFLLNAGLRVAGPIYDTMVMAQLVNENQGLGLKVLAEKYLGQDSLSDKALLDKALSHAGVKHVGELCRLDMASSQYPNGQAPYYEVIARYCREDVNNTIKLFAVLKEQIQKQSRSWREVNGAKRTSIDYLLDEAFPVEEALLSMEVAGIRLDPAAINEAQDSIGKKRLSISEQIAVLCSAEIGSVEDQLYAKALDMRKTDKGKAKVEKSSDKYSTKFNLSSGQHIGQLIYERLEAPKIFRTRGGAYSTSEADLVSLKQIASPESKLAAFLELFSSSRELDKLHSTYAGVDSSLLKDALHGRVYSYYLQAGSSKDGGKGGTATGRLSSQSPNMQNLPRGPLIKRFFIPDSQDQVFAYFDYSQVELRIAAHLSRDEELLGAYQRGDDLHAITARSVFGKAEVTKEERQVGKTLNFALIYDAKAYRLWQMLGPLGYSIEDCEQMRKEFYQLYAGYKEYLKQQTALMIERQALISEAGRVRRLPDIAYGAYLDWRKREFTGTAAMIEALKQSPHERITSGEIFNRAKKKFNHAQKQGFNFPIQSLGASIAKRAMIQLHKQGYELVSQVHDSIIVQLNKRDVDKVKEIQHTMETAYKLSVPLVAEGKLINSLDEGDKYEDK